MTAPDPSRQGDADRLRWFNEARYGMFIHWGAYSVGGRGEWVMNRERIPAEEYTRLFVDEFHAERFDPDEWVRLAREAGMGYMVLTARHHDGFALWDTATRTSTVFAWGRGAIWCGNTSTPFGAAG